MIFRETFRSSIFRSQDYQSLIDDLSTIGVEQQHGFIASHPFISSTH